jgi:hypothetical protein
MKFPAVMTNLGFITAIAYECGDEKISFTFPKRGLNRMVLACSSDGKKLFGMRARQTKPTQVRFNSRYFEDAAAKFEQWSGFEVDTYQKCKIKENQMRKAGRALEISYLSDKWTGKQREYFHTFENLSTVHLDNDDDPNLIYITGKRLRVTERGIEG